MQYWTEAIHTCFQIFSKSRRTFAPFDQILIIDTPTRQKLSSKSFLQARKMVGNLNDSLQFAYTGADHSYNGALMGCITINERRTHYHCLWLTSLDGYCYLSNQHLRFTSSSLKSSKSSKSLSFGLTNSWRALLLHLKVGVTGPVRVERTEFGHWSINSKLAIKCRLDDLAASCSW